MDLEDQFSLEHLLFRERTCRVCGETKDVMTDFYITRKPKKYLLSSYSYECKDCTIKRITNNRKGKNPIVWEYPDW
jgi:hypothetical protein